MILISLYSEHLQSFSNNKKLLTGAYKPYMNFVVRNNFLNKNLELPQLVYHCKNITSGTQ